MDKNFKNNLALEYALGSDNPAIMAMVEELLVMAYLVHGPDIEDGVKEERDY